MKTVSRTSEKIKSKLQPKDETIKRHPILILSLVIVAIFLLSLAVRFNIKGSLAQYKVAGITFNKNTNRDELKKALETEVQKKKINIVDQDYKVHTYPFSDAGLKFNADKTIDQALQAQKKADVFANAMFFKIYEIPLVYDKDDFLMDKFIASAMTVRINDPVDATLDTTGDSVRITPESAGKAYVVENAKNRLINYATENRAASFKLQEKVIQPKVTAAALKPLADNIKSISNLDISVRVLEETYRPTEAVKLSWITNDHSKYTIKKDKVIEYIDEIAGGYESNPTRQVSLKRPDGSEQIIFRGSGGYTITNKQGVADKIADSMLNKKAASETLSVAASDPTRIVVNDYPKWIIVNLSSLRLDAYEGNQRIYSFPVSAGLNVSPTITGEFKIYQKTRRQTMRGTNGYGQPYSVPNVEWISYFSGNYGIHGNYWAKPEYFGAVNSTSGCVGLKNSDAQPLWEWSEIGTPVIVHY